MAEKYGGKWFLGLGSLVTAVFTLLTPIAAKHSTTALIAVRVVEGLGEVNLFLRKVYILHYCSKYVTKNGKIWNYIQINSSMI